MFGTLSQNSVSKKTTLGKWISINPKKEKLSTDLDITFLPMASVSNDGKIIYYTTRKSGECEKGFIQFKDEDVLFAKITPCMENGKGCVAQSLNNGYGYGTTEFIVLRSNKKIINPFWLHYLISTTEFRNDAAKHMTGTAGQKRVPPSYFSDFKFNLPPIELQNKYVEEFLQIDKLKFSNHLNNAL